MASNLLHTLPSSDADAIRESSNGDLSKSVSLSRSFKKRDVPVCVQHGRGMATEERYQVRHLAALFNGNDCECTTPACLPIYRDILRIDLVTHAA